jgi:aminoglycoside phosphotransferase (APT) family kinase protein
MVTISTEQIRQLLSSIFPHHAVTNLERLTGGLINTNIKASFESRQPVVLRIYRDGAEAVKKEVAIHYVIGESIPVPKVLHAASKPIAFSILEFVEGTTLQELKQTGDLAAIQQASASAGKTLAHIGRFRFDVAGRLLTDNRELIVGEKYIEGADPIPGLLRQFMSAPICSDRLGVKVMDRLEMFVDQWSVFLPDLDEHPTLVHSDFGNRNILVHERVGRWEVAAVLDWEFAFSGSPLLDVGHFLRYERMNQPLFEPHFSRAFVEHGGELPTNWREIVRVIDLTALVQCLTIEDLPGVVANELIELITATIELREVNSV